MTWLATSYPQTVKTATSSGCILLLRSLEDANIDLTIYRFKRRLLQGDELRRLVVFIQCYVTLWPRQNITLIDIGLCQVNDDQVNVCNDCKQWDAYQVCTAILIPSHRGLGILSTFFRGPLINRRFLDSSHLLSRIGLLSHRCIAPQRINCPF